VGKQLSIVMSSPVNILLDDNMNACLGDFGIAKFYLDSRSTSTGDSKTISSTGVKGTIGYIPPGTMGVAKFYLYCRQYTSSVH